MLGIQRFSGVDCWAFSGALCGHSAVGFAWHFLAFSGVHFSGVDWLSAVWEFSGLHFSGIAGDSAMQATLNFVAFGSF